MSEVRDIVWGTAGHIDHGKTAIIRALTGIDTDRLPEEKARGITVDIGFARLEHHELRLAFIDVPGHERLVRNMLAGATGIDLALLVVAADDSVMPQTREHLEILQLLCLSGGVVALTKADLVDTDWLALVRDEIETLLAPTFLKNAPIVTTSAATGQGIDALKEALVSVSRSHSHRDDTGFFRLAIDRAFTLAGHGAIVTGTVSSGAVSVGDELVLLPEGTPVRVRGLHQHDASTPRIGRGARAAINLAGVHHQDLRRGQILATPGFLAPTRLLTVELQGTPAAPQPIRHRGRYRLHLGTSDIGAKVALLSSQQTEVNDRELAQIYLAKPVAAIHGQPFILRAESPPATLGGGFVIQAAPRRIRRRELDRIQTATLQASAEPKTKVAAACSSLGLESWSVMDLCRETALPPSSISVILSRLQESGELVELPLSTRRTIRLLREQVDSLESRVLKALDRLHKAAPRLGSIPASHLISALPELPAESLVFAIIDRLRSSGQITGGPRNVARTTHKPLLSQAERKLKADALSSIQAGGLSPPDAGELSARAGSLAQALPDLLQLLVQEGLLVEIQPRLFLDVEIEQEMRRRVTDYLGEGASMTMAELRDLLGTTRKFAVPLGEYLDRIGLTRRENDLRWLVPDPVQGNSELPGDPQRSTASD